MNYIPNGSNKTFKAGPPKKLRKHTRLQDKWDLEGYKIPVTFDEMGQPVGEEGNDFTNFLGTLVKMPQHLSLEFLDWRKVPEDKKDDLWNIVNGKFEFVPAETNEIRKWVLSDRGTKFKSWNYESKKKWYDSSSTVDDIVDTQNVLSVDKTQFKKLVTHWFNQKTEVESETKKKIRKYNEPHVTGTKSFARLIHDERKKNNCVRPSRETIYRISRTRKDGTTVNKVAAEVVDKLRSSTHGSTSSTGAGVLDYRNDDLAKVKGPEKGGRV